MISLNFLNECKQTGNVVIEIKDYENIGWYFDYYNHVDGVILCGYCNQPVKKIKNNQKYCKNCAKIVDNEKAIERISKLRKK